MSQVRFANNVSTQLLFATTAADTEIYVKNLEQGLTWPDISAQGDYFMVVVDDLTLPTWEIMRCTKVEITPSHTTLTVDRGVEGTVPNAFGPGASVENRLTAATLDSFGEAYPAQVPVGRGGTGASNPADARTNLDVPSKGEVQSEVTRLEDLINNKTIVDASTSQKGIVQLSSATDSEDETMAATPKAVKAAFDLATDAKANSATADKLTTARTLSISGDGTGSATFDGSTDVDIALDIPDASTSAKGLVQLTSATASDSEDLAATAKAIKTVYEAFNEAISNLPTYTGATTLQNGVPGYVPAATPAEKDYVLHGDGTWKDVTAASGPVLEAERLATARDINLTGDATGTTSFDGSADVDIAVTIADASTTTKGLVQLSSAIDSNDETVAATSKAVKLIADALASITPGGVAETAKKLETPRAITLDGDVTGTADFDGSADITINTTVPAASTSAAGIVQLSDATNSSSSTTAATSKAVSLLNTAIAGITSGGTPVNATTADKLKTPRNITLTGDVTGSASFDGSQDISIAATVVNGGGGGGTTDVNPFKAVAAPSDNLDDITTPGLYYGTFTNGPLSGLRDGQYNYKEGYLLVCGNASNTDPKYQILMLANGTSSDLIKGAVFARSSWVTWNPWVKLTAENTTASYFLNDKNTSVTISTKSLQGQYIHFELDPDRNTIDVDYTITINFGSSTTKKIRLSSLQDNMSEVRVRVPNSETPITCTLSGAQLTTRRVLIYV